MCPSGSPSRFNFVIANCKTTRDCEIREVNSFRFGRCHLTIGVRFLGKVNSFVGIGIQLVIGLWQNRVCRLYDSYHIILRLRSVKSIHYAKANITIKLLSRVFLVSFFTLKRPGGCPVRLVFGD